MANMLDYLDWRGDFTSSPVVIAERTPVMKGSQSSFHICRSSLLLPVFRIFSVSSRLNSVKRPFIFFG